MSLRELISRKYQEYGDSPIMGPLGDIGHAVDTPFALARGVLAGKPGTRATGRNVLEAWGAVPDDEEGLDVGDVLGAGLEEATAFGLGAILKAKKMYQASQLAKAASAANKESTIARRMASAVAKHPEAAVLESEGLLNASKRVSDNDVVDWLSRDLEQFAPGTTDVPYGARFYSRLQRAIHALPDTDIPNEAVLNRLRKVAPEGFSMDEFDSTYLPSLIGQPGKTNRRRLMEVFDSSPGVYTARQPLSYSGFAQPGAREEAWQTLVNTEPGKQQARYMQELADVNPAAARLEMAPWGRQQIESHFDGNNLAFLLSTKRKNPEGGMSLVAEQMQSDPFQDMRIALENVPPQYSSLARENKDTMRNAISEIAYGNHVKKLPLENEWPNTLVKQALLEAADDPRVTNVVIPSGMDIVNATGGYESGQKAFYDVAQPNRLQKLANTLPGREQVGPVSFGNDVTGTALPFTEAMRQHILKHGLPLMSIGAAAMLANQEQQ